MTRYFFGVLAFLYLFSFYACADFIDLQELTVTYRNFGLLSKSQRSLMTNPDPIKEGVNFGMKNDIVWSLGYLNAEVQSATTDAQYRYIALELSTGIHLSQSLDLGLYHLSGHGIDRSIAGTDKYPSSSAIELRVYLFRAKDK